MYPEGEAGLAADTLLMMPWFAPNMTQAELEALVAPLFATFTSLGLSVVPTYAEFDNFYDAWQSAFPLEFWGINIGRVSVCSHPQQYLHTPFANPGTIAIWKILS